MPETPVLSGNAVSARETAHARIDEALARLDEQKTAFARLSPSAKADLLEACLPRIVGVAERWVRAACEKKGLPFNGPESGEEWVGGPASTARNTKLLIHSLRAIAKRGKPRFGAGRVRREDGRLELKVFPQSTFDAVLIAGFEATHLYPAGIDERSARERQASFYDRKDPEGEVSLILGAGNVSSIPPMDALYKSFVEGRVCLIKMNPVNEYVGPFIEEAFRPLIDRGYWQVCYGGADAGKYLVEHEVIGDIHITGSDRTHDLIVWGPPGADRDKRKAANDPLLKKTITSELGNITPVVIIPGPYTSDELALLARNVASQVVNNGSFNCNAAKMIVTSEGWPQREAFLAELRRILGSVPPRRAYYPGAKDRYEMLTEGREVWKSGPAPDDALPWGVIAGVDPRRDDEPLYRVEPFCALVSETPLAASDPEAFLAEATAFCNDRLWGTLSMTIMCPPAFEKVPTVQKALDKAIMELRYGAVAVNHWSAAAYGFVSTAWGGHPSATLADCQSGLGWVHNTFMLDGFDKVVVRGQFKIFPTPLWFTGHRTAHQVGRRLVGLQAYESWLRVPGIAFAAMRG